MSTCPAAEMPRWGACLCVLVAWAEGPTVAIYGATMSGFLSFAPKIRAPKDLRRFYKKGGMSDGRRER